MTTREESQDFLRSVLGKTLRIETTDTRTFVGEFKCTDNVCENIMKETEHAAHMFQECNIILAQTYEYRRTRPTKTGNSSDTDPTAETGSLDMSSRRFLGLVVVPGQHIVKIEVEGT